MSDPTGGDEVLRGEAAPRRTPKAGANDPSNTPIDELTEDLDARADLARLAQIHAAPDTAEDTIRESVRAAGAHDEYDESKTQ